MWEICMKSLVTYLDTSRKNPCVREATKTNSWEEVKSQAYSLKNEGKP